MPRVRFFVFSGGPAWNAVVEGDRISVVAAPGDGGIPSKFELHRRLRLARFSDFLALQHRG
jgi:hypothetical protein